MPHTITITSDDDLHDLLTRLGDTTDAVHATLRAAGIKGLRKAAYCCPIANWVAQETGCDEIEVDLADTTVMFAGQELINADNPYPIVDFVTRFDAGDYPDLEG